MNKVSIPKVNLCRKKSIDTSLVSVVYLRTVFPTSYFTVPKEPDKDSVLSVNSTSVTFAFASWPTQICSIRSFTCQYTAARGGSAWIKFPRRTATGDTFTVGQLQPATVYIVRLTVHTDAGDTSWEHTFATRTKSGGKSPLPVKAAHPHFPQQEGFFFFVEELINCIAFYEEKITTYEIM